MTDPPTGVPPDVARRLVSSQDSKTETLRDGDAAGRRATDTSPPFSYRFYARRTPGDEKPSLWCGDIDGPIVYEVRRWPLMILAHVHAAWLNYRRGR